MAMPAPGLSQDPTISGITPSRRYGDSRELLPTRVDEPERSLHKRPTSLAARASLLPGASIDHRVGGVSTPFKALGPLTISG